jgi:hypothetical protein
MLHASGASRRAAPEFARILGATPYALRRGGISLRLRTEDPQFVANECGTSLRMLSDHYSFPIEDLRQHTPGPPDVEWRAARAALMDFPEHEVVPSAERDQRRRRKFFAWFGSHTRAARASSPDVQI